MTDEVAEPQRWSRNRWWTLIGAVLVTQLALILWLGRPQKTVVIRNDLAPSLELAGPAAAEILALSDPTLFALPHHQGFSGQAWLKIPAQEFRPYQWSEAPHWLNLIQDNLGASFKEFASTNPPVDLPIFAQPALTLKQPEVTESELLPTHSEMRLTGSLAARRLLAAPELPRGFSGVPGNDILTNSVVQVLVGGDGKPASTPVLVVQSGSAEADQWALRETRKARFAPAYASDPADPLTGLSLGQFVFEWRTFPSTNSATGAAAAKVP